MEFFFFEGKQKLLYSQDTQAGDFFCFFGELQNCKVLLMTKTKQKMLALFEKKQQGKQEAQYKLNERVLVPMFA